MLAAAIITLRETLEICLLLGIISAAINSLRNKNIILCAGIIGGILISCILAITIDQSSKLFNDNGQEIINIIILLTSIICIAFTLIWINKHSKELHHKINAASQKFLNKEASILYVILIITLTIGREGTEIILFLNGVYASGTSVSEMISGIIIGLSIGTLIGFLLYTGLLKLQLKYFFKTINILLILLAAGMASQLANYLITLDLFTNFSANAWDISWLINENSFLGKILYSTLGYSSKPTQLQVILYLITILSIVGLLNNSTKSSSK